LTHSSICVKGCQTKFLSLDPRFNQNKKHAAIIIIPMHGLFITGTDTGIGKTTICTGLLWFLHNKGIEVGVMKPFAAADKIFSQSYRSEDTYKLATAAKIEDADERINPFFYNKPASPFVASKLTHEKIPSLNHAVRTVLDESKKRRYTIIEGIGGLLVPISRNYTIADFARKLGLPTVIVADAKLGGVNHTLLTLQACVKYRLDVIAVIINRMPTRPEKPQRLLVSTLRQLTGIKVIFSIPDFHKEPDPKSVAIMLDKKWHIISSLRL
jgi:dethiobiotin synthetase